ncbi:MAG TPA: LamG-like jellyroll fold domain-containing protein, partial [Clostridia bacterium]|nr:LamG-like jellyroll fold domain-containing protein [Clostridia bacterium]
MALLMSGLAFAAYGQGTLKLTPKWSIQAGTRPYLDTASNWPRTAFINRKTGNVIIPMGSATPQVHVVSGVDGSELPVLNVSGVSGGHAGTFALNQGGVADDGVIYICSLAVNTPVFQIWRWSAEDPSVEPVSAYGPAEPGAEMVRCGDSFAVRGAGKNTQLVASGNGAAKFSIFTTEDGTNFVAHQFALPEGLGPDEARRGLAFDGTNNAFYAINTSSTTVHLIGFDLETGTSTLIRDITLDSAVLGISRGTLAGLEFMPCILDGGESEHRLKVYDITDPAAPFVADGGDVAFPSPAVVDGNFTGGTDFGAGMVVGLSTHNGVVALSATVVTNPPAIVAQPQDHTVFASGKVTLSVSASGSAPLSYQWYLNGTTPVAGATSSKLTINNVQSSHAGDYTVVVTNVAGTMTSASAKLTVTTPTGYAAQIVAEKPLAYWRMGEAAGTVAVDSWGGHDGVYNGVTFGMPGYSLIDANTSVGLDPAAGSGVSVADGAVFTYTGASPAFTLEAWAKFKDVSGVQRLFSNWQSSGAGIGFGINGATGMRFTTFGVQDFDLDLTQAGIAGFVPGKWYHLVGVAEGGSFFFYINGQQVGSIPFNGEAVASSQALMLGRNPQGASEVIKGQLDETAIYDKALTSDQVRAHYEARYGTNTKPMISQQPASISNYVTLSVTFSVAAEGTEPITYQWKKNGNDLPGETGSTLTVSALEAANAGDYTVLI